MIRSIKIDRKFTRSEPRVRFKELVFNEDINILYGGNGSGKSSLIKFIRSKEKNKGITIEKDDENKVLCYVNSNDNVKKSYLFEGMQEQIALYFKSEGEGIYYSLHHFIGAIEDCKETIDIVLIDELDSGLSCELQSRLFKRIKKLSKKGIQFIITVNTYQLIKDNKGECINILNGEHIKINSYNEFYEVAKNNRKIIGTKF